MGDLLLTPNDLVEFSITNRRATIRFVSLQTRNALSTRVLSHLEQILGWCEESTQLDELYFTGTATIFSAGADLREIDALTEHAAREFALRGQRLMDRIADLRPHSVAAVNGHCYGGGLDLALACDRRIASSAATFCHPGAGIGIITGWGGTQRLTRLVGSSNACEMFFTAKPISASRALAIGLVDEITDGVL